MSIYISADAGEPAFLGSNKGWADFTEWVDSLDDAPELAHLCDYGWNEPASAILAELESQANANPPDDDKVKQTVSDLAAALQSIPPDAAVAVNNGVGKSDEA